MGLWLLLLWENHGTVFLQASDDSDVIAVTASFPVFLILSKAIVCKKSYYSANYFQKYKIVVIVVGGAEVVGGTEEGASVSS